MIQAANRDRDPRPARVRPDPVRGRRRRRVRLAAGPVTSGSSPDVAPSPKIAASPESGTANPPQPHDRAEIAILLPPVAASIIWRARHRARGRGRDPPGVGRPAGAMPTLDRDHAEDQDRLEHDRRCHRQCAFDCHDHVLLGCRQRGLTRSRGLRCPPRIGFGDLEGLHLRGGFGNGTIAACGSCSPTTRTSCAKPLASALTSAGFEVVGQASDATGLLAMVEAQQPDVAVLDVRMPPTHHRGARSGARDPGCPPGTAILVLSQHVETRYAVDLLREDPSGVGYLLKIA